MGSAVAEPAFLWELSVCMQKYFLTCEKWGKLVT